MIESISIRGFQSHKDTELVFVPGINAIIGASSHGKTAIIRALEWDRTNRPLSDRYINDGMKFAHVAVKLDGHIAERYRDRSSKNEYKFDGQEFSAMGSDVPDCITNAFDFAELNVQGQFDPYFLLYESGGQKAAFINRILRLDEGDELLKWLNSERRRADSDVKTYRANVETLTESLKRFENLDEFGSKLDIYEKKNADASMKQMRFDMVTTFVASAHQLQGKLKALPDYDAKLRKLGALEKRVTETNAKKVAAYKKQADITVIRNATADVCDTLAAMPDYDAKLKALAALEKRIADKTMKFVAAERSLLTLEKLTHEAIRTKKELDSIHIPKGFNKKANAYETKFAEHRTHNDRLFAVDRCLDNMDRHSSRIDTCVAKLSGLKKELTGMEAKLTHCDRCGSKLTEATRKQLLGE